MGVVMICFHYNFFEHPKLMEKRKISQLSDRYNAIVQALIGSVSQKEGDMHYLVTPVDYLTFGLPILVISINEFKIQPVYHGWNRLPLVEKILSGFLVMPYIFMTDILLRATALLIKLPISLILAVPLTILLTIGQTVRVIFDTIHPSTSDLNHSEKSNYVEDMAAFSI